MALADQARVSPRSTSGARFTLREGLISELRIEPRVTVIIGGGTGSIDWPEIG
jgi:hypothetical protein